MFLSTPRIVGPTCLFIAGFACLIAGAQSQPSVFRCTNAQGQVSYQEGACRIDGASASQKQVHLLPNPAPVLNVPKPLPPAEPRLARTAARVASFTLYYDPTSEPLEHPSAQMEAQIVRALNAWMSGCKVELRYGGRAPYVAAGTPERVSVRWMPEYLSSRHPAYEGGRIGGIGGLRAGISLTTRISTEDLQLALVHELGHVLGLPHFHDDAMSVMSYLQDEKARRSAIPSSSDFLACNLSMKKLFGIEFEPPLGAANPAPGPMSDRDALSRKFQRSP